MELSGNVHVIRGTAEDIPHLLVFLEKGGMVVRANPDMYVRAYAHFGADEARELRERSSLGAIGKSPRVFIIATPGMTVEAQNALLKTLEEPSGNAMFFILVPSPGTLLPTLLSRAQRLSLPEGKPRVVEPEVDAGVFLKALPQKRLDMLKPLLEKGDDDKRDVGAILDFLSSVEHQIANGKTREGLRALYRARAYIMDKGALVKPLLEQMALLIPRM